jgi:hypothetical protein
MFQHPYREAPGFENKESHVILNEGEGSPAVLSHRLKFR